MRSFVAVLALMSTLLMASGALAQITPIADVQYNPDPNSDDSPLNGVVGVEVQGIVTAVNYYGQYWIQDAAGAWNGLYIYDFNAVAIGDEVNVVGTVDEYYNLTELKDVTAFSIVTSGNALPAMTILDTGDVADEQWEGTLVRVEDVISTSVADTYGEWDVDNDPTSTGSVAVGDAMNTFGYEPPLGQLFSYVQGPLDYAFDEFKIQPRDYGDLGIIPEPATGLLLMLGMGCLVGARRVR